LGRQSAHGDGQEARGHHLRRVLPQSLASDGDIDALCEQILMSSGLHSSEILADLVETTPGDEGKWFAAGEAGAFRSDFS
jgi:hypothetical protein